uniref:Ovule protein n=1 Tax=Parascaris univalens TaxID=6257 RepID=A0A915AKC3_PARUN
MARRELYARIEPKYITTCNMTVKTAVIIFVSVETLLMTTACMCCFWFAYFNLGALCVAILIWLIFILFGAMIGFQWALIPFGVLHCIAVLLLTFAVFSVITITICPYYQERWIDYLEDIAAENSYWLTRNQLYSYSRISFGICMGVFLLLISILVTLIKIGYMAYHYLGHYIDKDSPNFEKFLERAVQEAYKESRR